MENGSLSCQICFLSYDSQDHEPRIIPFCGHNLCLTCLINILNQTTNLFKCPFCTAEFKLKKKQPSSFPKNLPLISMIEERKAQETCSVHHSQLEMVCIDCKEKICNKCALKGSHRGHEIDVLADFIKEINTKVREMEGWSSKLTHHLDKVERGFEEEKKKLLKDVESKFNWYIGQILKKKDEVTEQINTFFASITNQDIFSLREELKETITKWKNDNQSSFEIAFKILSDDLSCIIQNVKQTLNKDSEAHVRERLKYINIEFKENFQETVESLCRFGEILVKEDDIYRMAIEDTSVTLPGKLMQIFVKTTGKIIPVDAYANDKIETLKEKIQEKLGVPIEMQWLTLGMKNLIHGRTLEDYDIEDNSTIFLTIRPTFFRIFIRLTGGDRMILSVRSSTLIKELKKEIETVQGIPIAKQNLYLCTGVLLEDEKSLKDYKLSGESSLFLLC